MRRAHFLVVALAVTTLVVSLGASWWTVSLNSGAQVPLNGLTGSPVAGALLAVAGASFGLTLLIRGAWRRAVSALHTLAGLGAGYYLVILAERPESAALVEIAALSGVSGQGALELVASTEPTVFLWVGLFGVAATVLAGALGALMPERENRVDRYAKADKDADPSDSIVAWDLLSGGDDPTTR